MTEFERKQLRWTRLTAIFTILIFLLLLMALATLAGFMGQIQEVMTTLNEISRQLGTVDWAGVAEAMDSVAAQLQSSQIEEIIDKLNTKYGLQEERRLKVDDFVADLVKKGARA